MKNIRPANINDNASLHLLTESLPMEGDFLLRIDRKPDFFALLNKRGISKTYLASQNNLIEGCISISKKDYLMKGSVHPAAIISDVKFLNTGNPINFARLLRYAYDKVKQDSEIKTLFVTVAEGNAKVERILKGRIGLPQFNRITKFDILQILSKKKVKLDPNVHYANLGESHNLLEFYKIYLRKFDVANCPVSIDPEFEEELCYIKDNKIVAALRLMDTSSLKQNVLLGVPRGIQAALGFLKILKIILGLPKMPEIGMPIDLLYVRYYAHEDGQLDALLKLIEYARYRAYQKNLTFLSLALCEHLDILKAVKRKFFHLTFRSSLYQASLQNGTALRDDPLLCFEDYAVV